jgi:hypothetical protein
MQSKNLKSGNKQVSAPEGKTGRDVVITGGRKKLLCTVLVFYRQAYKAVNGDYVFKKSV